MTTEEKVDLASRLLLHITELKRLTEYSQEARELLDDLMFDEFGYD